MLKSVVSWEHQVSPVGPAAAESHFSTPFQERWVFALDDGYIQAPLQEVEIQAGLETANYPFHR